MLLVQQRNPTDEMNEQGPQASFQNSRQTPNPPPDIEGREITGRPNFEHEMHNFLSDATICNGSSANSFDFFSRARFVSGEIAPAANEMRSTTPKSADEWAFRAMTTEQPLFDQSQVLQKKEGVGLSEKRGAMDNGGETTTWGRKLLNKYLETLAKHLGLVVSRV